MLQKLNIKEKCKRNDKVAVDRFKFHFDIDSHSSLLIIKVKVQGSM